MKILLLEDDLVLGETIQEMLIEAGYHTLWVKDGAEAAEKAFEQSFDLYVLDINVPELNGFDLLEGLREAQDETPTIFISAMTDIAAMTKGFRVGANDYLKKPFYPQELLLRIEAKFGRLQHSIHYGDIVYDPRDKTIRMEGKVVSLGDLQFLFFDILIHNIGKTVPKKRFLDVMEHPSENGMRVALNKLKQITQWDIQNIRGIGYRIEKS
ncbi:MAG: response regulator transcription factor [Sulfuricurvum sp.]|uniref:response regulator transcription factor n=1 Tax=Sulfuricurvum sp. TaxID=2025608 RepID=UPI002A13875C|nr:response regulator transcription factor [Sulfuricurvum sp.]